MTGTVVISLDFELGWGHKRTSPEYVKRLRQREGKMEIRVQHDTIAGPSKFGLLCTILKRIKTYYRTGNLNATKIIEVVNEI